MDGNNKPPSRGAATCAGGAAIGGARESTYNPFNDPYFLHSSDHLCMILVLVPLVGTNYLSWSRLMKIALGAKHKLSFINGKVRQPEEGTENFEQ